MMRNTFRMSLSALLLLALTTPLLAQSKSEEAPDRGPKIGTTIKNFSLTDQLGKKREWKQFLGKGAVAVVFYRSADW